MEEVASNSCDMEEASSTNENLDGETRTKLVACPLSKVSTTRKEISFNLMEHMMILEHMDPRRLKAHPDTEDYY